MGGVTTPVRVIHFTYIEGGAISGHPLFRCETCKLVMTKGVAAHSEKHGGGQVIVDVFTTLEANQATRIMEEVRNTTLTYMLLETTDRDDIPAFECADCKEKLTALDLGTHLKVHGARTYRIDSRRLDSPRLVAIEEQVDQLRRLINLTYLNSRERSLALTNLETTELWLAKCQEAEAVPYTP